MHLVVLPGHLPRAGSSRFCSPAAMLPGLMSQAPCPSGYIPTTSTSSWAWLVFAAVAVLPARLLIDLIGAVADFFFWGRVQQMLRRPLLDSLSVHISPAVLFVHVFEQ